MVQRLDELSPTHHPWIFSGSAICVEIMLQLLGVPEPDWEAENVDPDLPWSALIGRTFGDFVVRLMEGTPAEQRARLAEELKLERPVGLLFHELDPLSGRMIQSNWVVLRMNQVGQYIFLDAVRRHPDSTPQDGRFTERRVLRLDQIAPRQIEALIYCEPLTAPELCPRPGRPRQRRG